MQATSTGDKEESSISHSRNMADEVPEEDKDVKVDQKEDTPEPRASATPPALVTDTAEKKDVVSVSSSVSINSKESSDVGETSEIASSSKEVASVASGKSTDSSIDEELRIAQAMALAIQKNPNMTPAEARELVVDNKQNPPKRQSKKQQFMFSLDKNPIGKFSLDKNAIGKNFKNTWKAVFDDKQKKENSDQVETRQAPAQERALSPTTTEPKETQAASTLGVAKQPQVAKEPKVEVKQTKDAAAVKKPQLSKNAPAVKKPQPSKGAAAVKIPQPSKDAPAVKKPQPSEDAAVKHSQLSASSKAVSTAKGKKEAIPVKAAVKKSQPTPSTKALTATKAPYDAPAVAPIPKTAVAPLTKKVVTTENAVPTKTPHVIAKQDVSSSSAEDEAAALDDGGRKEAPIRLATNVWKRRSGLGKFAHTGAWERRRLVLQGTKLLYFSTQDGDAKDISHSADPSEFNGDEDANLIVPVTTKKPPSWFEQATALVHESVAGKQEKGGARGALDLVKELATVAATLPHSGSPTPFCVSIMVKGETKWKFAFDDNAVQMEWVAALTDVVVGKCVNLYNGWLVEASDPHSEQVHNVMEPPGKGHNLWVTGDYEIRSQIDDGAMSEDEEDAEPAASSRELHLSSSHEESADDAKNHTSVDVGFSFIPDRHLQWVGAILNFSLLVCRASATSVDLFWLILTVSNVALYCLVVHPPKKSVGLPEETIEKAVAAKERKEELRRAAAAGVPLKKAVEKPKFKPNAGSSTMKIKDPRAKAVSENGDIFAGWMAPEGQLLMVRGHDYMSRKKKIPSPGTLYKCAHVDIFESPNRYPDMAPRVNLPELDFGDGDHTKTWHAPDWFVISIALPTDPPKMMGGSSDDGGGYTITMYYTMLEDTREILRRVTADGYDPSKEVIDSPDKSKVNAVRLFEEWCRRAPTDNKYMARFKVVPYGHNLTEIGMPGWIQAYNNKPFLIKRPGQTGFLYRHPHLSCMEFDVSLHPFPLLAKKAICFMKESFFHRVLVSFGFVIEGRADDELPECLIGLMELCYPDPKYAIQAADFFAGTSKRSY